MNEYLSFKITINDKLISAKSIFRKAVIGEINGRSIFVNALWFNHDLEIRYFEIATLEPEDSPESAFINPQDINLSNNILNIPKTAAFLKINSPEYEKISDNYIKELAWISCWGFSEKTKIGVGKDNFKIEDFLIDPQNWKILEVTYRNWLTIKKIRPSSLLNFDSDKSYFQFAESLSN